MRPNLRKLLFFWVSLGLFGLLLAFITLGLLSPPFICAQSCPRISSSFFCLIVHRVGVPFFGYTLAGVSLVGLSWGIFTLLRATASLKRTLSRLGSGPLSEPFPGVFLVPAGSLAMAFSAGYLRPKVFVTSALWDQLDTRERQGLLMHEAQHVKSRDGFMLAWLELVSRAFFLIPLFAWLKERFKEAMELAADDAVLKSGVSKETLALALIKVARAASFSPYKSLTFSPGFEQAITLRLQNLLQPEYLEASPPSFRRPLVLSLPGICWAILPILFAFFHNPTCVS